MSPPPALLLAALLSPAGAQEIVRLPAYTVTDTRVLPKPESWRYASIATFEVLSTASDSTTRKMMDDFLQFHRAVDLVWPLLRMNAAVPASIILCGREKEFAEFVPADVRRFAHGTLSLSFQNREEAAFVIELDPGAVGDDAGGSNGAALSGYTADILHREYVRFLLGRLGERAPPWLHEGLWKLFTAMKASKEAFGFPAVSGVGDMPARVLFAKRLAALPAGGAAPDAASDPAYLAAVKAGIFVPLDRLLATGPQPDAGSDTSIWAQECYEFAFTCLFGHEQRFRKPFLEYAFRSTREPSGEMLFQRCFGLNYAGFLPWFWGGVDFSADRSFSSAAGNAAKDRAESKLALRDATDGEVGRIKGEALRVAGRSEEAHFNLIAPYLRGSRDPELLASLGLEEAGAGKAERARRFLEAAVAAHTHRARAYEELANLRLEEALKRPAAAGSRLSIDQLAQVLQPLFNARSCAPALPEVYELIAKAWSHSGVTPQLGHLKAIDEGVGLFPYDGELILRDAQVRRQYGYNADAAALCDLGLKYVSDEEARRKLLALKASLPLAARPAPAK